MKKKTAGMSRYRQIGMFIRGSKRYFALGIFFSVAVAFLDMINPKIVQYTVDEILGVGASSVEASQTAADEMEQVIEAGGGGSAWIAHIIEICGGREYLREHLYLIALGICGIALLGGLCRYLYQLVNTLGAERMVRRMRDMLFEQIQHLPYAWHGENHTGDIIQRCTSDVETVKNFVSEQMTALFRVAILIGFAMFFMIRIHGRLALISGVFIPIVILYSVFFHNRIAGAFLHADEEEGRLSAIAQENLTGVRVVRAFGRELYERERFETQNKGYTRMWIRLMGWLSAFWCSNDFITGCQIMLITVIGAVYCVRGQITVGEYIAFASYNGMLSWPVRELGRVISDMSKAGVSLDRISYIMNSMREDTGRELPEDSRDTKRETESSEVLQRADKPGTEITFEHVTFSYDEDKTVLQDVSFTLPAGTTLGILGGTGAGKSTLTYLLDRLYDLPEGCGRITLGGRDIRELPREKVRRQIGLVLQEPYLFSRTLAENIAITQPGEPDMRRVKKAAGIAALEETIGRFRDGYDTYVGERGVTLSGGQRQRTAIAQVLMAHPPIMVFDDSLSAVDMETDARIRQGLHEVTGDASVILIAHRITTLMHADRIIVLDRGRIAEQGTHEELLAADGIYRRIYDIQMQGAAV